MGWTLLPPFKVRDINYIYIYMHARVCVCVGVCVLVDKAIKNYIYIYVQIYIYIYIFIYLLIYLVTYLVIYIHAFIHIIRAIICIWLHTCQPYQFKNGGTPQDSIIFSLIERSQYLTNCWDLSQGCQNEWKRGKIHGIWDIVCTFIQQRIQRMTFRVQLGRDDLTVLLSQVFRKSSDFWSLETSLFIHYLRWPRSYMPGTVDKKGHKKSCYTLSTLYSNNVHIIYIYDYIHI